jgi:uroporphyrinogen decarboxylase
VSAPDAQQAVPNTCLDGNIKSLSFVEATPDVIAEESSRLLNAFASRGGFILSSGCEIPLEAKPENVAAMVAAERRR